MTAYRPRQVNQLDGSQYAGLNCTCAAGAMALDRETLGKKTTTGARVRTLTGDTTGGTRQQQVATALFFGFQVNLDVQTPIAIGDALTRLDSGQGMMLAGQSSATRGTKYQASETFGGNHQWFVNERRRTATDWEYFVYDPLADGRRPAIATSPFWLPRIYLVRFAERLDLDGNGTRLGPGKMYAVFTHDTEPHLVLYPGAKVMTPPYPGRINVPAGQKANVRRRPTTNSDIVLRLANGERFIAYQAVTGEDLNGNPHWYGNIDGTRWVHASAY